MTAVIPGPQSKHSIKCCLLLVNPGTSTRAGGDEQTIKVNQPSISKMYLMALPIQPNGCHT
jgi:hypothetical protein